MRRAPVAATSAVAVLMLVLGFVSSSLVTIPVLLAVAFAGTQSVGMIAVAAVAFLAILLGLIATSGLIWRYFEFSDRAEKVLAACYLGSLAVGVVVRKILYFSYPPRPPFTQAYLIVSIPVVLVALGVWAYSRETKSATPKDPQNNQMQRTAPDSAERRR